MAKRIKVNGKLYEAVTRQEQGNRIRVTYTPNSIKKEDRDEILATIEDLLNLAYERRARLDIPSSANNDLRNARRFVAKVRATIAQETGETEEDGEEL